MRVNRALVVGAGIGGLAAATALSRAGAAVDVVEIKPDGNVVGIGINQPGNSLRALNALGVLDDVLNAGFTFDGNDFRDWHDNEILRVPSSLGDDRVPANCALTRADLAEILRRAAVSAEAHIRYGVTVEDIEDGPESAVVSFTDGRQETYDLVAAFDGARSSVRRRLFGTEFDPVFTGCSVWRLQLPRPPEIVRTTVYQGDRVKGGLIPLSERLMYLLVVTQEPGNPHYASENFGDLLVERMHGFKGPLGVIRDNITGPEGIIYSPLVECCLPAPWHRGRVIVLGDAAHTTVPHLTQGAAMALEDAIVLADEVSMDRPLDDSLTAVAEVRGPRVGLVNAVSRAILDQEMSITADLLPLACQRMREEMPGQVAHVESVLNASFRSPHAATAEPASPRENGLHDELSGAIDTGRTNSNP
ncbi:FAD-dependent monooxygenase [Lentzea sp. E54]|uniref:FAD-dependent monooxygenase n=1 Tax=Lentzea xerophila TaxID=3435883 RepID=UPI003DA4DEE5